MNVVHREKGQTGRAGVAGKYARRMRAEQNLSKGTAVYRKGLRRREPAMRRIAGENGKDRTSWVDLEDPLLAL